MNIKYIQANGEADSVCSKLNKNGIVDMVLSDDVDLLVTGTKNFTKGLLSGNNRITVYKTEEILNTKLIMTCGLISVFFVDVITPNVLEEWVQIIHLNILKNVETLKKS